MASEEIDVVGSGALLEFGVFGGSGVDPTDSAVDAGREVGKVGSEGDLPGIA